DVPRRRVRRGRHRPQAARLAPPPHRASGRAPRLAPRPRGPRRVPDDARRARLARGRPGEAQARGAQAVRRAGGRQVGRAARHRIRPAARTLRRRPRPRARGRDADHRRDPRAGRRDRRDGPGVAPAGRDRIAVRNRAAPSTKREEASMRTLSLITLLLLTRPAGDAIFTESFDDDQLPKRGWYDGSKFKIAAEGAFAGKGCIEYHW